MLPTIEGTAACEAAVQAFDFASAIAIAGKVLPLSACTFGSSD